jgi:hypothetical protein
MDAFEVCASCSRHLRTVEVACPFCRAPHRPCAARPPRRTPRSSRAVWLATTLASSVVLAGCTNDVDPPGGPADGGAEAEASFEADAGWHTCYGAPPARLERRTCGAALGT